MITITDDSVIFTDTDIIALSATIGVGQQHLVDLMAEGKIPGSLAPLFNDLINFTNRFTDAIDERIKNGTNHSG